MFLKEGMVFDRLRVDSWIVMELRLSGVLFDGMFVVGIFNFVDVEKVE